MRTNSVLIGRFLMVWLLSLTWSAQASSGVSAAGATGILQVRVETLGYSLKASGVDLIMPATDSSQIEPSVDLAFATRIGTPLSVELEYFIGTADYPSHILLEWQSVSEQQTAAFRLKRGTTPDPAQAIIITDPVILAHPGSTTGYYYSYQDNAGLIPGVIYYYWIEDQDLSGIWNQHLDDPNLNPVVPWGCSRYDVVCNFVIDIQDVSAIANLWNCALGSTCYDRHFDVNRDDIIDVIDVMLSAGRWGCVLGQACYP